ncbi:MAG: hypothetical protein CL488_05405 [Acidobacteria bacterium]|nr:hypothetical protein [Acidobacteriota bacterium]
MATNYFSDLYAGLATPSTLDAQKRASAGLGHGRLRYSVVRFDPDEAVTIDSNLRLKQFKSGDRINSILISSPDSGTGGLLDVGIHKSGANHDGAVVDFDLFATDLDIKAGLLSQVDIFDEAALDDHDRGKTLWELNGDSSDPMEDWDLSCIFSEATTDAAWEMTIEIFYNSGD